MFWLHWRGSVLFIYLRPELYHEGLGCGSGRSLSNVTMTGKPVQDGKPKARKKKKFHGWHSGLIRAEWRHSITVLVEYSSTPGSSSHPGTVVVDKQASNRGAGMAHVGASGSAAAGTFLYASSSLFRRRLTSDASFGAVLTGAVGLARYRC
ncbi:uncharacterized protein BKA78DRAFT_321478, partial [Phyllosticta capitalensis]|uniref:uncharacterized protein n=1 Tax=Phyllosticta capitalensis TaxID=121624 RepID=UPI00313143C7